MNIFLRIGLFCFFCCGIVACNNNKTANTSANKVAADTAQFYPVANFIADEMKYVDLRNFTIVEKKSNLKDTSSHEISKDDFLSAASVILQQAQWFMSNKYLFNESIFQDLGTESYTINYSSTKAPIKSIDLLLNQQTNLPKRLFIRVIQQVGDTTITEQYSWIANKQFVISSSKRTQNGFNESNSKEISWKNQEQ
ncbi:hypothetical protein [Sediminibacterium sp.]|uniref:hypothetical protein n=1 Tax=Sediminibacterium sp. TaxID=1917865 RepID=UPI00273480B9|nr:hypothetical protein [Sediminibacterium sp.]MDP3392362.1 hypothetical protein [Sediminibacterium sp.]MDP3566836.1 hypothetical protein [Sediminibacterium sp.]